MGGTGIYLFLTLHGFFFIFFFAFVPEVSMHRVVAGIRESDVFSAPGLAFLSGLTVFAGWAWSMAMALALALALACHFICFPVRWVSDNSPSMHVGVLAELRWLPAFKAMNMSMTNALPYSDACNILIRCSIRCIVEIARVFLRLWCGLVSRAMKFAAGTRVVG